MDLQLQIRLMERQDVITQLVHRRIPVGLRSTLSPEDVLQEVWIAAYHAATELAGLSDEELTRWLIMVAKSRLISRVRTAGRVKRGGGKRPQPLSARRSSWANFVSGLVAKGPSPSSGQSAAEAVDAVQEALQELPSGYRQAVTLHHLEGRTHVEVAGLMQKSPLAVHGIIYRAMGALKERLGSATRFFSDDGSKASTPGQAVKK